MPDNWQDISSAPRDGMRVLMIEHGLCFIGRWAKRFSPDHYGGDESAGWYNTELDRRADPSAWQPLPSPPTDKEPVG